MQVSAHSSGNHLAPLTSSQLDTFLPEIELKKSIFMMTASQPGEEDTSVSQPPGKKLNIHVTGLIKLY
jgi:hypothetical protein